MNKANAIRVVVRLCPAGEPTTDHNIFFERIPVRGETLDEDGDLYTVVEVIWTVNNWGGANPLVIAHENGRPRAVAARS